jgi:hypothetical protein
LTRVAGTADASAAAAAYLVVAAVVKAVIIKGSESTATAAAAAAAVWSRGECGLRRSLCACLCVLPRGWRGACTFSVEPATAAATVRRH